MRGRRRARSEMTKTLATLVLVGVVAPVMGVCPSDGTTEGFSEVSVLQASLSLGIETNYTICPSTTFIVDEPLTIAANNTLFSCGEDGLLENNCVLESTELPFLLNDESFDFSLRGVTFRGVNESMVLDAYSSCQDCQYEKSCFSGEVENLVTALKAQTIGQTFQLCADTLFSMEGVDPLVIHKDNITIQCGESGAKAEQCAFWGGETQINVQSDGVRLRGITMISSKRTSVLCSGASGSKVFMEDCEWSGHTGLAAVVLYNGTLDDISSYSDVADSVVESMGAEFEICSFLDNGVSLATIINVNGAIVSRNTTYEGNSGESVITSTGATSIQESCFVHNNVTSGVVQIADAALLISDSAFYGNGNIAEAADGCSGIYAESDGSCTESTATSCAIASLDSDSFAPSLPAVQTASLSPSMAPSSSLVPSAISSSNASLIPSALNETLSPLNQSLVPSMAPSETSSQNNSIADPPASNDTDVCISGFDALLEGLNDDNSSGTFKFCNTTVVDFSGGQEPLLISTSNVIIDCPSCVFRGGDEHIVLQGSVSNVTFRGISFIDAGSRSIFANLSAPSSIVFEECTWTDNRGSAAIWLDNMDYVPLPESAQVADSIGTDKDDDLFPGRLLQDDSSSVSFACDQCVFDLNNGRDGILVSSGVSLDLSRVRFDSNQAEGAIINAKNVAVDISSSCFVENRYGKRLLDADFTLALSDLNFGANNTKTGGLEPCDGLGSAVICLPFEATACFDFVSDTNSTDSTNSTNSTMPPITNSSCVNNWDSLADAFEAATPGNKTVLMICENATLEVGEPIIIASDAAVQCGIGGSSGNNCTITGGITHFILKGVAMSVSFAGIAFEKAEVISVRAFGSNESRAIFSDCSWKSHFGPAAVLVYNEIDGLKYTDENIERLASSDSHAMKTTFENCYFHDNEPSFAAIAVVDGRVDVISSAFEQNELMTAGVIAGTMGTELSLFSSCFIRNQALTSGTVYLDSLSELVKHDRLLFGDTNVAGTDTDCQDVLESTLDTCLIDGICTGFCTAFEAGTCNLPFLNSSSADEQTNPPNENRNSSSSSNGTDVVTELKPLSFKRASPNILIIVNILIIILTLIGGFIMYYRCTKKHSDPHLPKDGAPPSPETTDLLGNLGGKFGFGKKALSTVAETNEEESGDDESGDDESVFADEVAKESRPAVTKDVSASNLSTMSGMFGGIRQFEEEDSDSDEESAAFLGSKSESNNSLMLGHSSGKIKKKKKLRVIKKIKRTINKGKKEDEAEPTTAGSESNLTLSRGRSYGSAFDNSTSSDVFGEDYDLGSMFS